MEKRSHYTSITHKQQEISRWRKDFFNQAGPSLQLLCEFMSNAPGLAVVIKDAHGRIMYMNEYNIRLCGWRSSDDTLGYTSEELYPPNQAAVYGGRDREVMETGVPIVERIYGYVADRSTDLNCVTVRPVIGLDGSRIGTATVYWRAERKQGIAIYNIGTGHGYSVLDVVNAFIKANGVDVPYSIKPRRPGDIATCYCNPAKAKAELGWEAQYGIEDMCRDSWNWQKNNPNGFEE